VGERAGTQPKRIIVLGSTGSIGVQTLQVVEHLNTLAKQGKTTQRFEVVGLAAGSNHRQLIEQAKAFGVRDLALANAPDAFDQTGYNFRFGNDAPRRLIEEVPCDLVVGAIVGIAGLDSTLRALELGIDVALANKETLVAAGALVIAAARKSGASLLPVDSEHAGVWQCLQSFTRSSSCPPTPAPESIKRVILTASGGSFRTQSRAQIQHATLDQALKHPNWSMGAKVTIDSATLMNKALELIEAHWLFGLDADQLGAVIHPQSIVHALVECVDGSVIAQLGAPDMKAPIQHALDWPNRSVACADRLDITKLGTLDFQEIDPDRFPAINLAMNAIKAKGSAGAILNAANERAVEHFIAGQLPFAQIDQCVASVMAEFPIKPITTLADVYQADACARESADQFCANKVGGAT